MVLEHYVNCALPLYNIVCVLKVEHTKQRLRDAIIIRLHRSLLSTVGLSTEFMGVLFSDLSVLKTFKLFPFSHVRAIP